MYLTKLILNPRSPEVVRDLANPYEFHRTIMRAFPDRDQGGPGRVLYRIERLIEAERIEGSGIAPVVLVQSEYEPDWTKTPLWKNYISERFPSKVVPTEFAVCSQFRFRLRANPTVKRQGKRHGLVREDDQLQWLHRKAADAGFRVLNVVVNADGGAEGFKRSSGHQMTHLGVLFDGELEVVDPALLKVTIQDGIGSAKGFGFGLLSLAKA